jgi:ribosomal protein S18 acetylase RimI-like enzyme
MRVKVAAMADSLPLVVTVRTASLADTDAILDLWARGAGESSIANDAAQIERMLARDPEMLLLALDDDGRIVGSVIAGFDGWRAHVYRMAVLPEARKLGAGRALVEAMETRFRALGAVRSDAIVLLDNDLGRAFWAACGYEPDPKSDRWVRWL